MPLQQTPTIRIQVCWVAVVVLLAASSIAQDAPHVLTAFEGKQLLLRTPAPDRELHFDPAGRPTPAPPPLSPLAQGVVRVRDIRLHAAELEIYAERVAVGLGKKLLTSVLPYPVLIHAALPPGTPRDATTLRTTVDRIFHPEQETAPRLLAYWRRTVSGKHEIATAQHAEQPIGFIDGGRPVYMPDPPRIKPPRATYQPGPFYNDDVRRQGSSGQVIVDVIVNERGEAEAMEIEKSSGEIMDLATIHKLSQWRFEPGSRRGVPANVVLRVKVNFSIVPPKTH